jgi:hypothetical protein
MPSPVRIAGPGSSIELRVAALERELQRVGRQVNGALQIGPNQVGPVGTLSVGGSPILDSLGLIGVMTFLASSLHTGGQTLSGIGGGGDVQISTITFSLARAVRVMLIACSAGLVNTSSGPIQIAESVVCRIDGAYSLDAQGFVPCFGPAPAGSGTSQTLIQVPSLATGSHTVQFVWVSGANTETFHDFADSLFAFQLGA